MVKITAPLSIASIAQAASSHRVNLEPVRAHFESRLNQSGKALELGAHVDVTRSISGITALAHRKAIQTARGFEGIARTQSAQHVISMGRQTLIVTTAKDTVFTARLVGCAPQRGAYAYER